MNFYPHHIGDFDKATRHLTRLERSIYRDLLDLYYDTERELPLDSGWICRKVIARSNEESTAVEQVLNEFFTKTPTGWYHERCEEEIGKYHANTSQKSLAGKASAAAKALKKQQALDGNSTAVERANNGTPTNQEPETKNQKPNKEPAAQPFVLPDWIPADTWAAYCKVRTGKKAKNEPHALGLIVKDLEKFRAAGHDPVDCLNNSIKSGWAGVFEPKAKFADKNTVPPVSTVWHESAAGVIAKAAELELAPRDEVLETFPTFKARVMAAAPAPGATTERDR